MSLPRFLDRVLDAASAAIPGVARNALSEKLASSSVTLVASDRASDGYSRNGFLLAATLLARLYPVICLEGPSELMQAAEAEITLVNPRADVRAGGESTSATLIYEGDGDKGHGVFVAAREWNVYVDEPPNEDAPPPTAPAALAAAAFGVGEIFRVVFADELGLRGRTDAQPGAVNLVTLARPSFGLASPTEAELGEFRLVGTGAIGQAAAHTLAAARVQGTMIAIDHERVALSNLQRYVLTHDTNVGDSKVEFLRSRLAKSSVKVIPTQAEWNSSLVETSLPTLVALDSAEARIGVQSSLPGPIYNAWTQPADIGWSRHERFGDEPCLACLYWPQYQVPSRHEQIATALGQHPLRVLAYLVHGLPVGVPLPPGGVPEVSDMPSPPDAPEWLSRSLLDGVASAAGVDASELAEWRHRPLSDLYQEGICGGGLLHLDIGEVAHEVLVPLAHQSALAGIMLATQFLVAQVPKLRDVRPRAIEARYDVLRGLPQVMTRPREATPRCLCSDAIFRAVYRPQPGETNGLALDG